MAAKSIVILGSTGSIGRSSLDVITRHPGRFKVRALAAYSNATLLEEQFRKFRPEYLCLVDEAAAKSLADCLKDESVTVLAGEEELVRLAALPEVELVLNAVVGAAGLRASLETVTNGRNLALANKESLVVGGPLFPSLCKKTGARILPIDSEHSAIWQALSAGKEQEVRRLILTSSGGPFRTLAAEQFGFITVKQALAHPTWQMGAKITIDSATLANKGLEIIEAVSLFSMPVDKIRVVIHPQSIIHSMVEFCDSSVIAQMSLPDMRLPITFALFWPERVASDFGRIDWGRMRDLTFEEPDTDRFPALALATAAARAGGTAPAVFNAANEVAVEAFLKELIGFVDIPRIIEFVLSGVRTIPEPKLDEILASDYEARVTARQFMEKISC